MPRFDQFFAGVDLTLVITSIIGGLAWGYLYNRRLNLPTGLIYHKFVTTTGYLLIILLSRLVTGGSIGPWERWIGFIVLWGVFCLCIRLGTGKIFPKNKADLEEEIRVLQQEKDDKDRQIAELERQQGGDRTDEESNVFDSTGRDSRDT